MTQQFQHLFSPIEIGQMTVQNRIVVPGHYPALREADTLPGEKITAYWESKARGGTGMICTGIWAVHPSSPSPSRGNFEFHQNQTTPLQIPGGIDRLKQSAERIQQHGTRFLIQLWHGGANAYGTTAYGDQLWAPSAFRATSGHVTHGMTKDEIKEVIEGYASEAARAKQAGVDGVEIHGAHGYLITQFMSPLTNKRTDEYGGDHAGRIRFACEIIDAIRTAVDRDFTVGIRISADLLGAGAGYTLDDTKIFAQALTASNNLDYIATGAGIPPMYIPLGALMYHAAGIKEVVDIPVIGGGRVTDPVQAEQILEDNQADLIFMNRALICDPEMPNKAREGRLEEIRHCMGCSEGCWMRVSQDQNSQGVCCTHNPTVGKETLPGWLDLTPAEQQKKVMIIGGGPAGLETARIAKSRGHDVSLWDKGSELGGMTLLAAVPPSREEFKEVSRYYSHQLKLLDVDVHLNTEVTLEKVQEQNPDAIVVATGSKPMRPFTEIPGMDQDNVIMSVRDVLSGEAEVGENVLIVDSQQHIEGLATADFLANQEKKVEVVFPQDTPAPNMEMITKIMLRQKLSWNKVKLTPRAQLKAISGNSVTVIDPSTQEERVIDDIDTVILSYGGEENNQLYYLLKQNFPEVYAAGDCNGVRKTLWAVHDGAVIGRTL